MSPQSSTFWPSATRRSLEREGMYSIGGCFSHGMKANLVCNGRLPDVPVIVKARYVSKVAEKKIKAAGGVVELVG